MITRYGSLILTFTHARSLARLFTHFPDMTYHHSDVIMSTMAYQITNLAIVYSTVNSRCKGQWRGALMFSLICAWINGSVNNREASTRPLEGWWRIYASVKWVIVGLVYGWLAVQLQSISEPKSGFFKMTSTEHISENVWSKFKHIHWRKCIWNCRLYISNNSWQFRPILIWPAPVLFEKKCLIFMWHVPCLQIIALWSHNSKFIQPYFQ